MESIPCMLFMFSYISSINFLLQTSKDEDNLIFSGFSISFFDVKLDISSAFEIK